MTKDSNSPPPASEDEIALGVVREELQGWIPSLASEQEIRDALEKAFDYRGDITLTLRDGRRVEGFIFDRRSEGHSLEDCRVRVLSKNGGEKIPVRFGDIIRIEFSGRDTASGKSFEAWVKRYSERKARGEKNISLEPEILD